jgi:hypothetical protein
MTRLPIPLRPDPSAIRYAANRSFARAVAAFGFVAIEGRRSSDAVEIAAKVWPDDRAVTTLVKAAVSPATTDSASALVQTVLTDFLVSLAPQSAAADLMARGLQLKFDGAGAISAPSISAPAAKFVGEGQPIPVVQGQTGGPLLEPTALKIIVTFSNELFLGTLYNMEASVGAALREASGASLDAAMFSTNAGTPDVQAPGLLSGLAPLTASDAMPLSEAMVADLAALASTVAPVAGNGGIVFVAAVQQAVAANLRLPKPLAYPVLSSAGLAPKTVIAVAANALVSATDPIPRIQTGTQGTFHMEDATPAPIVADDGTLAAPVRSLWQTNSVGLRMSLQVTWAMRASNGIAWMEGVSW